MNGLMRPIYDDAQALLSAHRLRREYRKVVRAGFRLDSGRIYLRAFAASYRELRRNVTPVRS